MTVHRYYPGINNVGSFMTSGRPFVTGSDVDTNNANNGEVIIEFPYITKSFTIINKTTQELYVHFDSRANTDVITYNHYISLPTQDDSFGFDVKCKKVYISKASASGTGSFQLHAEMTPIPSRTNMKWDLSGSGINSKGP